MLPNLIFLTGKQLPRALQLGRGVAEGNFWLSLTPRGAPRVCKQASPTSLPLACFSGVRLLALLAQFIGPGGTLGVSSAVWSCRLGCVNHRLVVTPCSAPASLGLLPTDGCFTSAQHPAGWVPDGVWCQGDAVHCCYALKGFIRIWMTYIVYYIA